MMESLFPSFRTSHRPCVIFPARPGRDEQHIIHGTVGRARMNAAMTAVFGSRYHVHETQHLTVWGFLRRLFGRESHCLSFAPLHHETVGAGNGVSRATEAGVTPGDSPRVAADTSSGRGE